MAGKEQVVTLSQAKNVVDEYIKQYELTLKEHESPVSEGQCEKMQLDQTQCGGFQEVTFSFHNNWSVAEKKTKLIESRFAPDAADYVAKGITKGKAVVLAEHANLNKKGAKHTEDERLAFVTSIQSMRRIAEVVPDLVDIAKNNKETVAVRSAAIYTLNMICNGLNDKRCDVVIEAMIKIFETSTDDKLVSEAKSCLISIGVMAMPVILSRYDVNKKNENNVEIMLDMAIECLRVNKDKLTDDLAKESAKYLVQVMINSKYLSNVQVAQQIAVQLGKTVLPILETAVKNAPQDKQDAIYETIRMIKRSAE